MLHEYHVVYSVQYYPRFHVTAVGLGMYDPCIRGYYCTELGDYMSQFMWVPVDLRDDQRVDETAASG
jgi:hypothetical protein